MAPLSSANVKRVDTMKKPQCLLLSVAVIAALCWVISAWAATVGGKLTLPNSAGSKLGPANIGPTDNLTKVANAIQLQAKSLTTLVTVAPGLVITQPVTISIGYYSNAGTQRITQSYVTSTGNHFLYNDREGDGKPRQMNIDITLSENKPGGGVYNYGIPRPVILDPLYDVAISPLQFTLLSTCNVVGDTNINFYWFSPDRQKHMSEFHTRGGRGVGIGQFAWSRNEVSASAKLNPPSFLFRTVNSIDLNQISGGFAPGLSPSNSNFIPGKTQSVNTGLVNAVNEDTCKATLQYTITYQLRWYPYL
jgi:hypothetical protein